MTGLQSTEDHRPPTCGDAGEAPFAATLRTLYTAVALDGKLSEKGREAFFALLKREGARSHSGSGP